MDRKFDFFAGVSAAADDTEAVGSGDYLRGRGDRACIYRPKTLSDIYRVFGLAKHGDLIVVDSGGMVAVVNDMWFPFLRGRDNPQREIRDVRGGVIPGDVAGNIRDPVDFYSGAGASDSANARDAWLATMVIEIDPARHAEVLSAAGVDPSPRSESPPAVRAFQWDARRREYVSWADPDLRRWPRIATVVPSRQ